MLKGTRKPLIVAPRDGHVLPQMKQMAALAGEAESFMIYAMPSPPLMHDEDALTKVIACAELDVPAHLLSRSVGRSDGPVHHHRGRGERASPRP